MSKDLRNSIVRVCDSNGRTVGTGFFVHPKGLVVTCAHVLEGLDWVFLEFCPGGYDQPLKIAALACPEWTTAVGAQDVAVLKVALPLPREARPLYLETIPPRLGESVDSFGFSDHNAKHGMPGTGSFIGITRDPFAGLATFVLESGTIARGFSGGPCVSRETGEAIGIVGNITAEDQEGKYGDGALVIPAQTVLNVCPVIEIGIPQIVRDLVDAYKVDVFQKYVLPGLPRMPFETPVLNQMVKSNNKAGAHLDLSISAVMAMETAAEEPRAIVVIGPPGIGKSRLLAEFAGGAWSSPGEYGLPEPFVPLLFTAQSLATASGSTVVERITGTLKRDGIVANESSIDEQSIDRLINGGKFRCAILIDGLDEISNHMARGNFVRRLAVDVRDLLAKGHLVVLTSRPLDNLRSPALESVVNLYSLPTLDHVAAERIGEHAIGSDLGAAFRAAMEATGLTLDTPLFVGLAAGLFMRKQSALPHDTLSFYSHLLSSLTGDWSDPPAEAHEIIDALGQMALSCLESEIDRDALGIWLRPTDTALRAILGSLLETDGNSWREDVKRAQSILNFSLEKSGLVSRSGDAIQWAHLLLRDYLIALRLHALASLDWNRSKKYLLESLTDPLWREALILFVTMQTRNGRGDELLGAARAYHQYDPPFYLRFAKDCIHRGAILGNQFLEGLFADFEEEAVKDQASFGSCAKLFTDDKGIFWHLLRLQRIPQAQVAIRNAIARADPDSMMSEWPNSERSKTFSPNSLYAGTLGTAQPLYVRP